MNPRSGIGRATRPRQFASTGRRSFGSWATTHSRRPGLWPNICFSTGRCEAAPKSKWPGTWQLILARWPGGRGGRGVLRRSAWRGFRACRGKSVSCALGVNLCCTLAGQSCARFDFQFKWDLQVECACTELDRSMARSTGQSLALQRLAAERQGFRTGPVNCGRIRSRPGDGDLTLLNVPPNLLISLVDSPSARDKG